MMCESRKRPTTSCKRFAALLMIFSFGLYAAVADARRHKSDKDKTEEKTEEKAADKDKPAEKKESDPADKPAEKKEGEAAAPATPTVTDFPVATRKLEEAYRKQPSADTLYQLGQLSDQQGKVAEAQDFMRRYLADPTTDANAPGRTDAERIMALPRPQSGEVQVLADQLGFVSIDGRLVGTLPLTAPLLVSTGQHVITVEMRDRAMKGKVKVADGRGVELSFNRASGAVVVTLPPAVIVVPQYSGSAVPAELQRRILQAVEQGVQKARFAVFSKDVALGRSPKLADCLNTLKCQAQLAAENEVDYTLVMRIDHSGQAAAAGQTATTGKENFDINMTLIDAEAADTASSAQPSCTSCGGEQVATSLPEAVRNMIKEGQGKPRGTLIVNSEPPGAEVKLGKRVLGTTPYTHVTFVGSYELLLEKAEYKPAPQSVEVKEGKPAKYEVKLAAAEPPPPPLVAPPPVVQRAKRPLWRLIAGGATVALGVSMMTFGISALSVNNGCLADPIPPAVKCAERFTTGAVGGSLLGIGLAVTAGGVVLLALPGKTTSPTSAPAAEVQK